MIRPATTLAAIAFTAAAFAGPANGQATRVKAGTLSCDISAGIGLIVGSQRQVTCGFTPTRRGQREVYVGDITKLGLDIGATAGGQMIWAVYAPTSQRAYALAGTYAGASAQATVVAGLGANVLVGGSNRTVALQPLSVEGNVGLNVAAGVAGLTLRPAR